MLVIQGGFAQTSNIRRERAAIFRVCGVSLLLWVVAALTMGCRPEPVQPSAVTLQALEKINLQAEPAVAKTPVIDVHAHTFNARDLPLQQIIRLRVEYLKEFEAVGQMLTNSLLSWIDRSIDGDPIAVAQAEERYDWYVDALISASRDPNFQMLRQKKLQTAKKWKGFWSQPSFHGQHEALVSHAERELTFISRVPAEAVTLEQEPAYRSSVSQGLMSNEVKPWLYDLVEFSDRRGFLKALVGRFDLQPTVYANTFGGEIDLFVSHMMDLGPVYGQNPDGQHFFDFVTRQIPDMEAAQLQAAQSQKPMLYFVAYDPFRPDALEIVRDAIEKHGAYGVKVYPPSGYRPADNAIGKTPRLSRPKGQVAGAQFDARYGALSKLEGGVNVALNARLKCLLTYCESNNVPVFAHCGFHELEAFEHYGEEMASPKYWAAYLHNHNCKNKPCQLRLCLAHAGDEPFWFGDRPKDWKEEYDWGKTVVALLREFPNVYAEFGASSGIFDSDRRAVFSEKLVELAGEDLQHKSEFAVLNKLMYGSDWFMQARDETGAKYLNGFRIALLNPKLPPTTFRKFFCANASEYLDLKGHIGDKQLPAVVREQIAKTVRDIENTAK